MRTANLLVLPFLVIWWVAKLAAVPVLVVLVTWLVLPDSWLTPVVCVSAVYLAVVLSLFQAVLRGKIRSLARGAFIIRRSRHE